MLATIKRHPLASAGAIVVGVPIIAFALWIAVALNYSYSSGERAGLLEKISKRGWVCKTWEGDLQLTALPGTAPEKFYFTTRSDSIATVLNSLAGKQVVLSYEQHKGLPGSCFGDTRYFVIGARAAGTT